MRSSSEVHATASTSSDTNSPQEAMCKLQESDSPVNAISNLKAHTVHSKLAMLFNKKEPFVPSSKQPGKAKGKGTKRKIEDIPTCSAIKKVKKDIEKAVTVIAVDESAISIPRDKLKLILL